MLKNNLEDFKNKNINENIIIYYSDSEEISDDIRFFKILTILIHIQMKH